jgi:eukaryotic-like serine/threonine-protein kinase
MTLASGSKLGPYEIVGPLGAGGMGEVYRARDTRLQRTVAIKILPASISADPVAKQRFEREAKTISGLNHPNICTLHDVGSQDGVDYLVMECVEGETLAKRLEKGPLPLEQTLKYGAQIADALDKAHRAGIVHRDLKPGNIMLTATGAKLLDFGLAKPAAVVIGGQTLTAAGPMQAPVTQEGTIVGTFQYMSPEQVEGKEVDGRSDIFSLGAVLYEMVTGKRAFEGKSQLSVASAILEREPAAISEVRPMTPPALDHAIRRSLAKDPDERWQMARDLTLELKWIAEGGSQAGVATPLARPRRKREGLAWALAGLFGMVAAVTLVLYQRLASTTPPVVVSELTAPGGTRFDSLVNGRPAISPDGRSVVFSALDANGRASLWVRGLDGSPARQIPGTEEAHGPLQAAG